MIFCVPVYFTDPGTGKYFLLLFLVVPGGLVILIFGIPRLDCNSACVA